MTRRTRHRQRVKPRFHRRTKPGAAPGTLKAAPHTPPPVIRVMAFDGARVTEEVVESADHLADSVDPSLVTWINVEGLGDAIAIRKVGELLQLHPLALEDVMNVHQRSKVEPYSDHLFVVIRLVALAGPEHLESEQIGLFLGKNYVVTFQQWAGDCFDPVRERIRTNRGRIREAGADYLAYALIDAVIDSYFPVVEQFADQLDNLEDRIATQQDPGINERIHEVRNDLLMLRRSIRPHRETLNRLVRDPHPLIGEETRLFLRDCYDHTVQLIDLLEVYREMCSDLRDYYLSIVSNRMNEIMKVLTIIATIFMPLSFVAGVYGMNFNTGLPGNMPELNWPYAYVAVWAVMIVMTLGMLGYFWRRGWIGRS